MCETDGFLLMEFEFLRLFRISRPTFFAFFEYMTQNDPKFSRSFCDAESVKPLRRRTGI